MKPGDVRVGNRGKGLYLLLSERSFLPAYSIWEMYILEKDPRLIEEEEGLDTARSDWLHENTEHFA